jgi:hypothetical protein
LEEWPDKQPAAVLGAVRRSKQIKVDPTMVNLCDEGPARVTSAKE